MILQRHGTRCSSLSQLARGEGGKEGDGEGEGAGEGWRTLGGRCLCLCTISLPCCSPEQDPSARTRRKNVFNTMFVLLAIQVAKG